MYLTRFSSSNLETGKKQKYYSELARRVFGLHSDIYCKIYILFIFFVFNLNFISEILTFTLTSFVFLFKKPKKKKFCFFFLFLKFKDCVVNVGVGNNLTNVVQPQLCAPHPALTEEPACAGTSVCVPPAGLELAVTQVGTAEYEL